MADNSVPEEVLVSPTVNAPITDVAPQMVPITVTETDAVLPEAIPAKRRCRDRHGRFIKDASSAD